MKNLLFHKITKHFRLLALILIICLSSCADHVRIPITGQLDSNQSNLNQIVKTKDIVNIYDLASKSSPVVKQVEYGYMLDIEFEDGSQWAKVKQDKEVIGYIQTEHLATKKLYKKGGSYTQFPVFNYLKPVNFLVFIIYTMVIFAGLNFFNVFQYKNFSSDYFILEILFPLLSFIYFKHASDALWVCKPSIVSWWVAIPMFILTMFMAAQFLTLAISGLKSFIDIFSDPLPALIRFVFGIISGLAFLALASEIIVEFTWVILLFMLSGSGGLTYLGTIHFSNGDKADLFG